MSQFIEMFGNPNRNTKGFNQYAISDIFDLQMGKTPERDNQNYWNKGVNIWISISDMQDDCKYVGDSKEYITDMAVSESGIKIIPQGTLLMSFKLTIGRVAIADKDIYTNEAIMAFKDKCVVELSQQWLYNLLTQYDWLGNASQAAKGKTLNKEIIGRSIVSIPPIEMQEEFATIVQQADKSKFIGFKSQFIEMFNGKTPNSKLRDWVDTNIVKVKRAFKEDDTIEYIDISSVDNTSNEIATTTTYLLKNAPSRAQQCVRKGDILLSTVRPNLKNIGVNHLDKENLVASTGFCILRPKKGLSQLIIATIMSDDFTNKMTFVAKGTNYPAFYDYDALDYPVYSPNVEELSKVTSLYKQADKSKYIN